ncbi:hypothetical protein GCM10009798_24850 [Nocardioides panacihumi]|uniref:DUF4430 domain-containing protein n=1 Tax=Nocardioides panacihumi TaxID=400774 RepID=A0ABN2R526_9ACTN
MIQRLVARLAAAVLVAAAATLALPSTPAQAAYCSSGAGVSVLVDYGALGGGMSTGCGSGSPASKAFTSAGFSLKQSPRQAGFVCQVNGKPADGNCLATDSYWGFFVSDDGKGWVYASQGVYQQAVDAGDSVALVWQSTSSQRKPGQGPAARPTASPTTKAPTATPSKRPSPKPSAQPSSKPSSKPSSSAPKSSTRPAAPTPVATGAEGQGAAPTATTGQASTQAPTPSESTTTAASAVTTPSDDVTPSDGASPSATTDAATSPTADGGGLPGWLAPGLIALLAVVAGGVAWARRAR